MGVIGYIRRLAAEANEGAKRKAEEEAEQFRRESAERADCARAAHFKGLYVRGAIELSEVLNSIKDELGVLESEPRDVMMPTNWRRGAVYAVEKSIADSYPSCYRVEDYINSELRKTRNRGFSLFGDGVVTVSVTSEPKRFVIRMRVRGVR